MMLSSSVFSLVIFIAVTVGLAWPLANRLSLDPAEKIVTSVALSLLGVFLFAWVIFICALPLQLMWFLPAIAGAALLVEWRKLRNALRDADTKHLILAQSLVTLWSIGWLALVLSYSGGDWMMDWFEHMERTWYFLDRGPPEILREALTSRPPLANVVNGAFLTLTQRDFSHYQFFSTLFASLAFLPAGLLARRWGGRRAIGILTVFFMVSPMYVENATFAWTKLPTVFFILSALYFFLRTQDPSPHFVSSVLFAVALASGLLTHYSAGPFAVVLGLAWIALGRLRRYDKQWWRSSLLSILAGTLILTTWFGWAFSRYGLKGTLLTNTSITDKAPNATDQLWVVMLNIRDTLVPHFLRNADLDIIVQKNSSGWWRDWFFTLYQTNLFFIFGSVAWVGIIVLIAGKWRSTTFHQHLFWFLFVTVTTILGLVVVGSQYNLGLAHICLQPIIVIGLTFLAAHWSMLPRPWQLTLIAGATVDFSIGILLQFGTQAFMIDRWLQPQRSLSKIADDYSFCARGNLYAKTSNGWVFFGDEYATHEPLVVGLLAVLLLIALMQTRGATVAEQTSSVVSN